MTCRFLAFPRSFGVPGWALVWVFWIGPYSVAGAIELHPTEAQIKHALEQGKDAAKARVPPDRLYSWFGATEELKPHGFLMTRLVGLAVLAAHFELRGKTPDRMEINRALNESSLLISIVMYGDRPDFAVDSYIVLSQKDRTIKPDTVRFDGRAARSAAWPNPPAYRAKVVASVPYAELNLLADTKISVFPGSGGEISFNLDFARID